MLFLCFSGNGSVKGGNSSQPLVQWSEVPGHTGLLYCMTQSTNNPVVLMIKPDAILVQEIKVVPAKAKVNSYVQINTIFKRKVVNIFLPICFNIILCFRCSLGLRSACIGWVSGVGEVLLFHFIYTFLGVFVDLSYTDLMCASCITD